MTFIFTDATISNCLTNQLNLSQPKISDCSYFFNTCKYVARLKMDLPTSDLNKKHINGLHVNVLNDTASVNTTNINLFIE